MPLPKDRNELYIFIDLLLLIPTLIFSYNFFVKIYGENKNKSIFIILSTLLFLPILWGVIYSLFPYGNHFMISMNKKSINTFKIFHFQKLSTNLISAKGVSCDFPLLIHEGFRVQEYLAAKNGALTILINLYDTLKISEEQKEMLLTHIFKTIQSCDVNSLHNGLSPLINSVTTNNYAVTLALLKAGANPNQPYINYKKGNSLTPLYFAELYLKLAKTDESKQSRIKIIELLKQAGARSEKIELPVK